MEHDWGKSGYTDPYISGCECKMCVTLDEALTLAGKEVADAIDKEVLEKVIRETNRRE